MRRTRKRQRKLSNQGVSSPFHVYAKEIVRANTSEFGRRLSAGELTGKTPGKPVSKPTFGSMTNFVLTAAQSVKDFLCLFCIIFISS